MSVSKKLILDVIIVIIGIFLIFLTNLYSPVEINGEKRIEIKRGEKVEEIADDLLEQNLIKSKFTFTLYLNFKKACGEKVLAGEYKIGGKKNIKQIGDILTSGEGIVLEKKITIKEGWTKEKIAQYLVSQGLIRKEEDFFTALDKIQREIDENKFSLSYDFLKDKPKGTGLEGYLFPDTYRVYKQTSAEALIKKFLDNFDKKMNPHLREVIKEKGRTIHQIVTLASIIEKEVAKDDDRRIVADIFYKRLENNLPLQADSTINYITKKNKLRSSIRDTKIDSPYNTYKYRGLPPGPICNPGMSSILAAIYPQKTDYWYFLTTPEGKVIFRKDYAGHISAKEKYLK